MTTSEPRFGALADEDDGIMSVGGLITAPDYSVLLMALREIVGSDDFVYGGPGPAPAGPTA